MTTTSSSHRPAALRADLPAVMRAVAQDRYGEADVLHPAELPLPAPGEGEVLVEVHAAGVDRGVWHLMAGRPYVARLLFGLTRPRNPVPGMDLAGVVAAVGAGVTRFAVGDRVFGIGRGAFAEYAIAPEAKLAHVPAATTAVQAAVTPISGLTALQALTDVASVQPGDHVLVIGASGGVGSFAVQIATALGAEVTGVASAAKADLVRSLGADHVLDHAGDDYLDGTVRYDVVVDTGGLNPVRRLRRALTSTGTLVIVGGEGGGAVAGGVGRSLRAAAWSPFVSQRLRGMLSSERREDLERLAALLASGDLVPAVGARYPLDRAPQAIADLTAGRARGKSVVVVRDTVSA